MLDQPVKYGNLIMKTTPEASDSDPPIPSTTRTDWAEPLGKARQPWEAHPIMPPTDWPQVFDSRSRRRRRGIEPGGFGGWGGFDARFGGTRGRQNVEIDLVAAGRGDGGGGLEPGLVQAGLLEAESLAAEVQVEDFGNGIDQLGKGARVRLGLGEIERGVVQEGKDDRLGALERGGIDRFGFFELGVPGLEGFVEPSGADLGTKTHESGEGDGAAEAFGRRESAGAGDVGNAARAGQPAEELGLLRRGEQVEVAAAFDALDGSDKRTSMKLDLPSKAPGGWSARPL